MNFRDFVDSSRRWIFEELQIFYQRVIYNTLFSNNSQTVVIAAYGNICTIKRRDDTTSIYDIMIHVESSIFKIDNKIF